MSPLPAQRSQLSEPWIEFLDTEWYGWGQVPEGDRDAWKQGRWAATTVEIHLHLVRQLGQPNRLTEIALTDAELIDEITQSVLERGFDHPMIVVVDKHGRMLLRDGHHRLIAATRLGIAKVPVRFEQGERIKSPTAVPVATMLPTLLLAASS